MEGQAVLEFQLGNAPQVFPQNGGFDFELILVAGMLVVAASTAAEVRTSRLVAVC